MGSLVKQNRATIVAALIIAALIGALFAWQRGRASSGRLFALVHDGAGEIHELPLDTDATLTVTTDLGSNTIVVEDGCVRVSEADCPNGTCLHERPISEPGQQIICLPHKLWIEVVPQGEQGGEMDVTLVEDSDDVDLQAR